MGDSEKLWNFVEAQESRRDSQLAREFQLALPHELSRREQVQLMKRFAVREFVSRGLVVEACVHENPGNVHCHLLCTMRRVEEGTFGPKCREMNGREYLTNLRERWARTVNVFLMARGHAERIDHRSRQALAEANDNHPKQKKENKMGKEKTRELQHFGGARQGLMPTKMFVPYRLAASSEEQSLRPEIFANLRQYFIELFQVHYPDQLCSVDYDEATASYCLSANGEAKLVVTNKKVTCATGSQDEVRLCIQACIDFGWSKIHLTGSEDFRRRAYAEALRRGYKAEDISGYEQDHVHIVEVMPTTLPCNPVPPFDPWSNRRKKFTK